MCAGKKKLAGLRAKMDELDAKRSALQAEIDVIMPALQDARAQKAVAMGQLSEARLPPIWVERARELKERSKALPGGCKTQLELQRAIKEAEYNIDHGSLSLKQEKLAMERIRELKKGKELVAAFEADQALLDKVREEHKAVQAELKPVTGNIDELRALATEKANIMDGLMASKSEVRTLRDEASQAFAELKSRLDESFAKVREQQSDAPKAVAAFFAAVQEVDAKLKREKNGEPPPPPPPPEPTAAEKKAAAKAKAEAEAAAKAAAEEAEAKAAAEAKEAAAKEKAEKKAAEKAKVVAEKAATEKKAAEDAKAAAAAATTEEAPAPDAAASSASSSLSAAEKKARAAAKKARQKAEKEAERNAPGGADKPLPSVPVVLQSVPVVIQSVPVAATNGNGNGLHQRHTNGNGTNGKHVEEEDSDDGESLVQLHAVTNGGAAKEKKKKQKKKSGKGNGSTDANGSGAAAAAKMPKAEAMQSSLGTMMARLLFFLMIVAVGAKYWNKMNGHGNFFAGMPGLVGKK